jgi:hypothetical protein
MRIDPHAQIVSCSYCRQSSFVHLPNRPDPTPPPGPQRYGHIHVPPNALRTIGLVVVLTTLAPIAIGVVVIGAVIAGVLFASFRARPSPPAPEVPRFSPAPAAPDPPSPADASSCEKAVACCRTVLSSATKDPSQARTCEALRALPPADCAKQLDSFRSSAKSMGHRCAP